MTVSHPAETVTLHHGDALTTLRILPDESVHAIICDPPYGLADHKPEVVAQAITAWATGDRERVPKGRGFMGRSWDAFVPPPAVWDECLRVLKPGGHLAVFAGSRTVDLMGLSIRLAGFEMRDGIAAWLYGSGFPKSRDVSKDLDRIAGAEREVVGSVTRTTMPHLTGNHGVNTESPDAWRDTHNGEHTYSITAPATDAAREWQGWGTALKPAHEPIILARKPLAGTVAQNVAAHRTGAINVGACRVATSTEDAKAMERANSPGSGRMKAGGSPIGTFERSSATGAMDTTQGRWPTNVVLAHHPDCVEIGTREVRTGTAVNRNRADGTYQAPSCYGEFATKAGADVTYGTNGRETIPAFDCHLDCQVAALDEQSEGTRAAKPSGTHVRHSTTSRGLYREKRDGEGTDTTGHDGSGASRFFPTFRYQAKAPKSERPMVDGKGHPTVKPLGLMRWLVRLLVPAGGVLIDPFAGSGATLEAARLEGRPAIGVERDDHAIALIHARFRASTPPASADDASADEAVELTLFG